MTVKFTLNYTDGDFTDNIEVPIYIMYRKGTSFKRYHFNRNPALIEHKELLVVDGSVFFNQSGGKPETYSE